MNFKHGQPIEFFDQRLKKWVPAVFQCIHSFPNVFLIRVDRLTMAVDWLTRKIQ